MSLNKRSLRKDAKAPRSIEDQLRDHEAHIKSRRGANRLAAFAALMSSDETRAIALVESLVEDTQGKNRAELGALLASTSVPRFVKAAVKGRYGDVAVHAHVTQTVLTEHVAALLQELLRTPPAEAMRRARALGVVPRVSGAVGREVELLVAALVDDTRLDRAFRTQAVEAALALTPEAVWARRDSDVVERGVAMAAGLGSQYVNVVDFDADAFVRSVEDLPRGQRAARISAARLPASAARHPEAVRLRLLCTVLDHSDDPVLVGAAADGLVRMSTREADDAVLARPRAWPPATVAVCTRLDAVEAHAVLAPLLDAPTAVDALIASRAVSPLFLDDAVALLPRDPYGAARLLDRISGDRAAEEIGRAAAIAVEHDDDDTLGRLLLGLVQGAPRPARDADPGAALDDTLRRAIDTLRRQRRPCLGLALRAARPRAGELTLAVDDALQQAGL